MITTLLMAQGKRLRRFPAGFGTSNGQKGKGPEASYSGRYHGKFPFCKSSCGKYSWRQVRNLTEGGICINIFEKRFPYATIEILDWECIFVEQLSLHHHMEQKIYRNILSEYCSLNGGKA